MKSVGDVIAAVLIGALVMLLVAQGVRTLPDLAMRIEAR